ncbi:sorting nexin-41/42, partial [Phenoliferia sp. Uapishka_3]
MDSSHHSSTGDLDESNPFREESLDDDDATGEATSSSFHDPPAQDLSSAYHVEEPEPTPEPTQEEQPKAGKGRRTSLESVDRPAKDAIQIVDALKTSEGASASYIVYCIRFENQEARRRYSDFYSLRQALCSLHPCYIVPPLPPKNSLSSYAIAGTNPSKAKEDAALVNRRRRMLSVFLNRVLAHKVLGVSPTFRRFLEPNVPWSEVLHQPPITLLPKNPLKAPSSDPTNTDLLALFASLPLPPSGTPLQSPDQRFLDSEAFTAKFSSHLSGSMEKVNRRLMKRWTDAAADWGEMGGGMNGFALRMGEGGNGGLEEATEKVGMAVDGGYTNTNAMLQAWEATFTEPLAEYTQFSTIIKSLLKYRHLKHLQYEITRELLESKRVVLEELERSEQEAQRLEQALARVRVMGDDGGVERALPAPTPPPVGTGTGSSLVQSGTLPRRSGGGLLGALTHTFHGIVDADPEMSRRNSIGKTREAINDLDEALKALTQDLRHASQTIQSDLDRFQRQKVTDIKEMCLDFARFHREWAAKNLALWEEAKEAIEEGEGLHRQHPTTLPRRMLGPDTVSEGRPRNPNREVRREHGQDEGKVDGSDRGGMVALALVEGSQRLSAEKRYRMVLRCRDSFKISTHVETTIKRIFHTTPITREFNALHQIATMSLGPQILASVVSKPVVPTPTQLQTAMKRYGLNEPQSTAIVSSLQSNGFSLIQGPPGTGKTTTILALIAGFLERCDPRVHGAHTTHPRILVCAPSNAAVDEIVTRLKAGVRNQQGDLVRRRIVRIGNVDRISASHKDVYLKALLHDKLKNRKRVTHKDGERARLEILQHADIVCSTLSSSGQLWSTKHQLTFPTVIIDEACQASEISTLIPLTLGCTRAILIGDPLQLPPTIISQKATALSFDRSLFVRLMEQNTKVVQLLSIQYRMHPKIFNFPSRVFYDHLLRDGPDMVSKTNRSWHSWLPPYSFVSVEGSKEVRSDRSWKNTIEALAVRDLYELLLAKHPPGEGDEYSVGVIAPYTAQHVQLEKVFVDRFGKGIVDDVTFNTVDGFQGQEKDIIFFSSTRGGQAGSGIGFVKDTRRMNVALTRARCSLVVLGDPERLKQDPTWSQLVDDAKRREYLKRVKSQSFVSETGGERL